MSQITNWTIPNSAGSAFRAAVNATVAALQSSSSGPAAPSPTVAGMVWMDTGVSPPVMRVRNTANTAWVAVAPETMAAFTFWGNPTGAAAAAVPMTTAQARTLLAPGQAVVSGTATDISAGTYGLLGSTPNFVAMSAIAFVACSLNANKTTAANIIQLQGLLWDVTAGASAGEVIGFHGQPASSLAATAAYSAHASALLGGLTVGRTYRIDVRALKQVAEGPLAVNRFTGSVFNI